MHTAGHSLVGASAINQDFCCLGGYLGRSSCELAITSNQHVNLVLRLSSLSRAGNLLPRLSDFKGAKAYAESTWIG